jgi:hypothetical protein
MTSVIDKNKLQLKDSLSLKSLVVRPIDDSERDLWDSLMGKHHYLGFKQLVGEQIRYIALMQDKWVALIGWASAAYKNGHRDQWIGWSPEQRIKRLRFVANNSRFLILPGIRIKNLASKILALNLKVICADWQKAYGHPVILAETFVDHNRFSGTCYKAAGWLSLGRTRGFGRSAGRYYRHFNLRTIFIKPLHKKARPLLSASFLAPVLTGRKDLVDLNSADIDLLLKKLSCIKDPRNARGILHDHVSTLAIGVYARLSGLMTYLQMARWTQTLTQDLLKRFGCRLDENKRKYLPPSEPTIRRIFSSVDNQKFANAVQQWLMCKEPIPSRVTAAHPVSRGGREL